MTWRRANKSDARALELADRHYSRRSVGSPWMMPPGGCAVLVDDAAPAVFGVLVQRHAMHAHPGAWVCTIFRREGGGRASDLIRSAVALAAELLGEPPVAGLLTFVDPGEVKHKRDPGRCFRRAGFHVAGTTKGGHGRSAKLELVLPVASDVLTRRRHFVMEGAAA